MQPLGRLRPSMGCRVHLGFVGWRLGDKFEKPPSTRGKGYDLVWSGFLSGTITCPPPCTLDMLGGSRRRCRDGCEGTRTAKTHQVELCELHTSTISIVLRIFFRFVSTLCEVPGVS